MISTLFGKKIKLVATSLLLLIASPVYSEEVSDAEEGMEVPTDFMRDVMMPIGIPVLSTYHAVRESIFLNTRMDHPNPMESIANFFLTPSQYLFAAKEISIEEKKPQIKQIFSYDNFYFLKTFASVISLPISQLLGATFKALAYLSPEVRQKHELLKNALHSASLVTSHLEEYQSKGLPPLYTDEFIPCQGHSRPSYLTKKQKVEIKAMKEVITLLEANNIVYWIDCGTCLGAYRYGGIIPWDWDIDLSILISDHDNVKKILSTLDPEKYQIQDWSSYDKPQTFLKLYVKETKNFIDIYHYQINEQDRTVGYVFTYMDSPFPDSWKTAELKCIKPLKYEEIFPLKQAKFDNLTVRAPNDVVAFLQSKYGENLDPTMVWDEESKTYKKVEDHPYYQ